MPEFLGWLGVPEHIGESDVQRMLVRAGGDFARNKCGSAWVRLRRTVLIWSGDSAFGVHDERGFVLGCSAQEAPAGADERLIEDLRRDPLDPSALPPPFAFAVGSEDHQEVDVFSDIMSMQPLYYCCPAPGQFIFATSLLLLLSHPDFRPELSLQAVFNYVHFHVIPGSESIYSGVQKLLPASRLRFRNGTVSVERYWPKPVSRSTISVPDLRARLRVVMHEAVRRRIGEPKPTACFLSGGLDSSTVTGMASRFAETHAFTIGFDEPGYDEMAYAKLAAEHFRVRHHSYYVTRNDVLEALPIIAQGFGEPFANLSSIPVYYCARLARDAGFVSILAGDGGDELFAGNERYLRQMVLGYYQHLPPALREKVGPLCVRLLNSRIPLAHKIGRYVDIAKHDLPVRLLEDFEHFQGFCPEAIFQERFLRHIDRQNPLHFLAEIVRQSPDSNLIEQLLWVDWQLTLADNDLRKVHYMCKTAGVRPLFPMLDQRIIELARTVPPHQKLTTRRLRHFYKESVKDLLPKRIINKHKHGFGLPFGEWLRDDAPLAELVHDTLDSLQQRHIFRDDFITECSRLHRTVHASYYGSVIGAMVLLELWLQHTGRHTAGLSSGCLTENRTPVRAHTI